MTGFSVPREREFNSTHWTSSLN